ncbi:MAG: hypothetical protein IKA04_01760 [Alistipes sp.]|nr:hypothetical protein [Alistipes sp.]
MISAETARKKMQEYSRDWWIKQSMRKLSEAIDREAARGKNCVEIDIREITMGAENLAEIGEMCILIEKELKMNGYRIHYSIDGELTISW